MAQQFRDLRFGENQSFVVLSFPLPLRRCNINQQKIHKTVTLQSAQQLNHLTAELCFSLLVPNNFFPLFPPAPNNFSFSDSWPRVIFYCLLFCRPMNLRLYFMKKVFFLCRSTVYLFFVENLILYKMVKTACRYHQQYSYKNSRRNCLAKIFHNLQAKCIIHICMVNL